MTSVDFVQDASDKALWLVSRECKGPRDTDKAMHRVADRIGVPYSALYNLRYRPPRDIFASVYLNIYTAYVRETARQADLSRHEETISSARSWAGRALLRAAAAVDRAADALDGAADSLAGDEARALNDKGRA